MSVEYLSRADAARLLNIPEATLARWIRQGLCRVSDASSGSIERKELLRWAREHGIASDAPKPGKPKPPADLLADAVERGAVTVGSPATAAEAIEVAIGAVPSFDENARERLLVEVLERERMASTGLGHGVALPHPRVPPADLVEEPLVSALFLDHPVDWAAVDGEPVFAVLLALSPSAPAHLQMLSRIAFVLRLPEFRALLHERPSRGDLVAHLRSIRKSS